MQNDSIPTGYNPNFDSNRPRLQVIRGLPGTGKSEAAKQYPCIHLELDQFCCRSGAYRWGESRDVLGQEWLQVLVHRLMKEGVDMVVTGTLAEHRRRLGWILYWAMKCGYEVWVQDMSEIKGNPHGVRQDAIDYASRMFQPYDIDQMARVNRYGHNRDEVRMSDNEAIAFDIFIRQHTHIGMMPSEYPVLPEIDGIGV